MGDPTVCSRFGTVGTLWPDHFVVRSGTSNRGCLQGNRESSLVSCNVARASLVADSQSNGSIERGNRSVEEMTRVILFDLSSRVGSPISVHSQVFLSIVEHATNILNKHHVASDGKSVYERLKRRQHRGVLLPFGEVALGAWLGKRFHTEEHIVARKGDLVIRSRAVKAMLEETSLEDLSDPRLSVGLLWSVERCPA